MELLRGVGQEIKVSVSPSAENFEASVKDNDGVAFGDATTTLEGGTLTVTVPYAAIDQSGKRILSVDFEVDGRPFTREIPFRVVAPYLEMWEIEQILGPNADRDEAVRVEAAVRHIINSYCGQDFDLYVGTEEVRSDGSTGLSLPRRLLEITSISENGRITYDVGSVIAPSVFLGQDSFEVTGSGWYLRRSRRNSDGVWGNTDTIRGQVIVAPSRSESRGFTRGSLLLISGKWGYTTVPDAVAEAARLLINDYACAEQIYRDRFLASVSSSDWSLGYHGGAYAKTGNARANLLLAPYVVNRMKVV